MSRSKGFTLIELLVVIAVIGLLASIVLVSINNARTKARDTRRLEEIRKLQLAIEMYYSDYGSYPSRHTDSNNASWQSNLGGDLASYLNPLPIDPVNTGNLIYRYDGGETDDYPGYGLMIQLEHADNYHLVAEDEGWTAYANTSDGRYYEIGSEPSYDSPAVNWWND